MAIIEEEGFSFSNELQFLYDEEKYGFTLNYNYDLSEDKHTLVIKGTRDKKETEPVTPKPAAASLKPGTGAADADRIIKNMKSDADPKGTSFLKLRFRSTYQAKNSVKLSWIKLNKAKVYVIYGNKCGSSNKPKRITATTGNVWTVRSIGGNKLRKGTYYKFIIVGLDSKTGTVTAKKKGTCYIYAYVQSGVYKRIKVVVS